MADSSTQPFTQPSQPTLDESGLFDDQQSIYGILVPTDGNLNPVSLKNTKPVYEFGKDARNDIQLPQSDVVSAYHFKILLKNHGQDQESSVVMLEDCSTNGTFVNQKKVGKDNKKLLQHGDEISFGIGRGQPRISYIYRSAVHFAMSQEDDDGVLSKYDFGQALGTGAFATVRQVIDKSTGIVRACKVMEKQKLAMTAMSSKMVQREVEILSQLKHAHIVGYVDYFEDEETIYIVMELASGGDMYKYISKQRGLQESDAKRLMRQIFEAMKYTHSLQITHRDLKPENILLTGEDPPNAKITDFGLAKAVDDQTFLKTICGTPSFLAPEIIAHGQHRQGYSQAVDAWSLGVIVYAALANDYPFKSGGGGQALMQNIATRRLDWSPLHRRNCSQQAIEFIDRLLTVDPIKRMTIAEGLNHPWLTESSAINGHIDNSFTLTRENTGTTTIETNSVADPSPSRPLFSMEMDDPFAAPARKRQRSQRLSGSKYSSRANIASNRNGHEVSCVQTNGVPMDVDGSSWEQAAAEPEQPQDFWAVLLPKANSSMDTNFGIVESPTQSSPLTIGRGGQNLINLDDSHISKRHCSLYVVDGKACIKDASTNGIWVNDSKLGRNKARSLEDCDEIALFQDVDNGATLTYVYRPWKDLSPAERLLSFKSINIPSDSGSKRRRIESSSPWARLNSINPAFDSVVLRNKYVVLGRDQTTCCHSFKESRLSKNHCSIVRDGPAAYITDLSTNGTYHNGNKLRRGKRCVIRSGDEVVLVHADEHDSAAVHRKLLAAGSVDIKHKGVVIGFVFTVL